MEQLENKDEVEFLFDDQKEKLTSPLLGSFLGKMAKAKIEKIKQMQKEKRAPLIKQKNEKKAKRLELRTELEKMAPITEEEEAEFNREYQELEELTELIDALESSIASPYLGAFIPEHIKGKLAKEYFIIEAQVVDGKKVQRPTITKWTELLDQDILEPIRSRQSELRTKTDDYMSRITTITYTDFQIKELEAEITELKKELETNREEEFKKKERIKRIFHATTRKANQLDVLIRSILSGTKADLRSIEGIAQGEVLTVQSLRDIKNINKLLVDIIEVSAAGETLIENFQEQETVLDIIKDRTSELDEKRRNLEPDKKDIDFEITPEKEESTEDVKVQAQQTEAEIEELKRQIEVIKGQQRKANIRQQEEEERLEKIQRQIDENSEKYFELLSKLNERRDPYAKEELTKFGKQDPLNPFAVQLDTQGLDLIDSQIR